MEKTYTTPERTLNNEIEIIRFDISDKAKVIAMIQVIQKDPATLKFLRHWHEAVNINELFAELYDTGVLTGANIAGFKACLKAICAKALQISMEEIVEDVI